MILMWCGLITRPRCQQLKFQQWGLKIGFLKTHLRLPGPVISGVATNSIGGVDVVTAAAAVNGELTETATDPSHDWLGTMPILNLLTVPLGLRGTPKPSVGMSVIPEVVIGKLKEELGVLCLLHFKLELYYLSSFSNCEQIC